MREPSQILASQWYLKNRLPCNWTRVDLQSRDVRLLRTLFEQKFLSREQIRNYFFDGKKRYAEEKLWKLRRFGWIEKLRAVFAGHELYLATKATHKFFCEQSAEVPASFELPDFRTVSHDLLVTEIRFLFEQIGFGGPWTSERVWKMGRPASEWAPDGVIQLEGDPFAIEVECVQKSNARYLKIFLRYEDERSLRGCLYVADESFLRTLLEEAKNFPSIYFVSKTELFEKKEKAVFKNADGDSLAIEDYLEQKPDKVDVLL